MKPCAACGPPAGASGGNSPKTCGVEDVAAISIMGALAQPTRLKVLTILARAREEGMTSGDLAKRTGAAANTMSAHLAVLSRAGVVTSEKDGKHSVYRAVPATIDDLVEHLLALGADAGVVAGSGHGTGPRSGMRDQQR